MFGQGRCSASQVMALSTTLFLLFIQFPTTEAKTFTVGDTSVFNYDPSFHNVAVVDVDGYNSCSASDSSEVHSTGNDAIKLSKGRNYFICSIPGHCDGRLKIAVDAS